MYADSADSVDPEQTPRSGPSLFANAPFVGRLSHMG